MVDQAQISAAQFLTALIAIAAALTGWVTLILANRRLRAERAIPVIQQVKDVRSGGCEIMIENVGSRPALDIVVSISNHTKVVTGGLRGGEKIAVGLPEIGEVIVTFRDASGSERRLSRTIVGGQEGPSLMPTSKPWVITRLLIRTGFLAAD